MQAIMETIFDVCYLIIVISMGIWMVVNAQGRKENNLFGIMAVVLGCGDAFHLVPRIIALCTNGLSAHTASLGFGKFITSITMTIFYVILYHIWQMRYHKENSKALTWSIYTLALIRVALCLFPQNNWMSVASPYDWGIYRNIPFSIIGFIMIVLFYREAKVHKDKVFRLMWLAILLSFLFYVIVILGVEAMPALGIFMIPKTCAYVWIILMGYSEFKNNNRRKYE